MLENLFRDAALMPAVPSASGAFAGCLEAAVAALLQGAACGARARAHAAAIAHALAFATWRSLVREHGLEPERSPPRSCALAVAAPRAS